MIQIFREQTDFLFHHLKIMQIERDTEDIFYQKQKYKQRNYKQRCDSRQNFLHQPVKNDVRIYNNIQTLATGQGDDYTTSCLLDYPYFKEHYKLTEIDLSK